MRVNLFLAAALAVALAPCCRGGNHLERGSKHLRYLYELPAKF